MQDFYMCTTISFSNASLVHMSLAWLVSFISVYSTARATGILFIACCTIRTTRSIMYCVLQLSNIAPSCSDYCVVDRGVKGCCCVVVLNFYSTALLCVCASRVIKTVPVSLTSSTTGSRMSERLLPEVKSRKSGSTSTTGRYSYSEVHTVHLLICIYIIYTYILVYHFLVASSSLLAIVCNQINKPLCNKQSMD